MVKWGKSYFRVALLTIVAILAAGCAANNYTKPVDAPALASQGDKAMVVFMRSSFVGKAIASSLFDITDDTNKLIAVIGSGDKIAYPVPPGKHRFMVVGESADFMDADLEAGKVYYAIVTPRMGLWKARFSLHPFKHNASEAEFDLGSENLKQWLSECKFIEPNDAAFQWAKANASSISDKRKEYLEKWDAMLEQDKKWRTLSPGDGLDSML